MLGQCIIAPRPTETRPLWPPDCPLQLSCACWRSQDATLIHVSIHIDSLFRDLHGGYLSKRIFKDIYVGSFLDFFKYESYGYPSPGISTSGESQISLTEFAIGFLGLGDWLMDWLKAAVAV